MELWERAGLGGLVFLVALLYSSVGHGGASGYLAALSLFSFAPKEAATTALLLNVLVAGTGSVSFWRAGHFSLRLLLPFAIASVPAAFAGGLLHVSPRTYDLALAAMLVVAAARLALPVEAKGGGEATKRPPTWTAVSAGALIGLASGVVGVGGGIFLSPLLLVLRWATPHRTAAVSAAFIVINSLSGLVGRAVAGNLQTGSLLLLVPVAFVGGLLGSHLGARRFSGLAIRRMLAVALLVASAKLVVSAL